jgi:hypothetical protein
VGSRYGMRCTRFAGAALAAVLLLSGSPRLSFAAQPPGYDNRDRGWDAPPSEFRSEIERRGFRDGIDGAQKDFENHRAPNVNNRDEYRHPHDVPGQFRDQYRRAFRRGYDVAVHRMTDRRDGRDRHDDRDRDDRDRRDTR